MMQNSIEACTALGGKQLASGDVDDALNSFRKSYILSKNSGVRAEIKRAMFNFGAALVAARKFTEGVEILRSVLNFERSSDEKDDDSPFEADVFYNLGLASDLQGNHVDAIRCYDTAVKKYCAGQHDAALVAGTACRLAKMYVERGEYFQAADAYGVAGREWEAAQNLEQQVICLCHEASLKEMSDRSADATDVASKCIVLCQKLPQTDSIGKLYNELGLIFAKCQKHSRAEACFKLAVPLFKKDLKSTAVVHQNLGAIYNCLGDYQASLQHHESAAEFYVRCGSRSGQGQCFSNLAYAYAQLNNIEMASEYYLHALQAAKDTKDRSDRWQALEGLGTVAFLLKKYDRAIEYFQKALSAFTDSDGQSQNRIVAKLTEVIKLKMKMKTKVACKESVAQQHQPNDEVIMTSPSSKTEGTKKITTTGDPRKSNEKSQTTLFKKNTDNDDSDEDRGDSLVSKQLVKAYTKKLEKTEDEKSSDDDKTLSSGGEDTEDEDDTATDNDQRPSSTAPLRTAPHLTPQTSSKPGFSTYISPLPGGATGTWKKEEDEPDYMTIRVKDDLTSGPPLPPRLYRQQQQQHSSREIEKTDSRSDKEFRLPQKPNPKQRSRACLIM